MNFVIFLHCETSTSKKIRPARCCVHCGGSHEDHWVSRWLYAQWKEASWTGSLSGLQLPSCGDNLPKICVRLLTQSDDVPHKRANSPPRRKPIIFYSAGKVALSPSVYIGVVNEIFIVTLGAQWMWCWTMLLASSYKPEGRSLPPSRWDNTSLSDLCWDEVCVPENSSSREPNPH